MRSRADACPGVLQVHAAVDGGLARVRLPGGRLGSDGLLAMLECAVRFGDGALHITSRGNVQLRGLPVEASTTVPEVGELLAAVGLLPSGTHERVRNLVASPWSGLAGGRADIRAHITELDDGLRADPALAGLPGRFLFGLDDGRGDVRGLEPDVCWQALDGTAGTLLLAGAEVGVRVPLAGAVEALLAAARAFVAVRGSDGCAAWRVRELPGRGAELVAGAGAGASVPAPRLRRDQALGVLRQDDGRDAVGVLVPLGRLAEPAARALAEAAPLLLVTPWREVIVPDLPAGAGQKIAGRLAAQGLVTEPGSAWVGVTACAGRPGCAKALADVRSDAELAVARQQGPVPDAVPVHFCGCSRGCGRPTGDHVAVLAEPGGYRLGGLSSLGPARVAALLPAHRAGERAQGAGLRP